MDDSKQQICTIRIAFPAVSDEAAIKIKQAIQALLADTLDAQIQFSIASMPPRPS